jgi:hypothetical protein
MFRIQPFKHRVFQAKVIWSGVNRFLQSFLT